MKILRVFPRRTKGTPNDALAFIGEPPQLLDIPAIADEIHVSVTFTHDKAYAEKLARYWECFGLPVKIGGPAYKQKAGEFHPGLYLGNGYTITSRGCPNDCWFCDVYQVYKGIVTELEIKDGWIIQDDNLLACSDQHIHKVFEMLTRQPKRPEIRGLEAAILKEWHVDLMAKAKTSMMYFANDTDDDYEPLVEAGKILSRYGYGLKSRKAGAYVLIGHPKDSFERAEKRLIDTLKAGFMPYAMLWKNEKGEENKAWKQFQRTWCRQAAIVSSNREYFK